MQTIQGDTNDEAVCRICLGEATPDQPLLSPCRCSGSIRHVHQECLATWVAPRGARRCDICSCRYRMRWEFQLIPLLELLHLFWQELWWCLCLALKGLQRTKVTALFLCVLYLLLVYGGVAITGWLFGKLSHVLADWRLGPYRALVYLYGHWCVAQRIRQATRVRRLVPVAMLSAGTALLLLLPHYSTGHPFWLAQTAPTFQEKAALLFMRDWSSSDVVFLFASSYLLFELAYLMLLVSGRVFLYFFTISFDDYAPFTLGTQRQSVRVFCVCAVREWALQLVGAE